MFSFSKILKFLFSDNNIDGLPPVVEGLVEMQVLVLGMSRTGQTFLDVPWFQPTNHVIGTLCLYLRLHLRSGILNFNVQR